MIIVNGIKIDAPPGASVSVINDVVYVNGQPWKQDGVPETGVLRIEVKGSVGSLVCDRDVKIVGNVEGDVKAGGSVSCDRVGGKVEAGGSVSCDGVGGDVKSGGSVSCDEVRGSVYARGNVNHD